MTIPEKLLIAAAEVRPPGETFTAEDLVVKAWELFPDEFGLAGYSEHFPDSNRVLTNIMGSKGMRGKGWLRKVGKKRYRLTPQGMSDGAALLDSKDARPAKKKGLRAELGRQQSAALDRLVGTKAARKVLSEDAPNVTFYDACGFWDITARSNANTLRVQLSNTETHLRDAIEALENGGQDELRLSKQQVLSTSDLKRLLDAHRTMQEEFSTELGFIRQRKDERRG